MWKLTVFPLLLCALACCNLTLARNYDSLLTAILARNREISDEFKQINPNGQIVFERYSDPDYLNSHPILAEGDGDEFHNDFSDEKWQDFLNEIEKARSEAAGVMKPNDEYRQDRTVEMPRIRSASNSEDKIDDSDSGEFNDFDNYDGNRERPMSRHSEIAWQNQLSGEHRVSGGSSELGQWINYALMGAGAEDDENEEEEPSSSKGMSSSGGEGRTSGEKTDSLPTYCNPPNPCPIGYDSKSLSTPCDSEGVEDTKLFNQHWIWSKMRGGECQCDDEHMRSCPPSMRTSRRSLSPAQRMDTNDAKNIPNEMDSEMMDILNPYMQGLKRKRLVAKKSIGSEHLNRRKRSTYSLNSDRKSQGHHNRRFRHSDNPYLDGFVLNRVTKKNGRFPISAVSM